MNKALSTMRFLLFIFISVHTFAQRTCPTIVLPHALGEQMDAKFNSLHGNLKKYDVLYAPITMKKGKFLKMLNDIWKGDDSINGFRIYLAQDANKNFRFLFTGLKDFVSTDEYYTPTKDGDYIPVPNSDALTWINMFQRLTLPKLLPKDLPLGNTTSYMYSKGLLQKYLSELNFHDESSPVKKIKIKLSVYINDNNNSDSISYINRIMVGFSFISTNSLGINREISVDNLIGSPYGCEIPKANFTGVGLDTGTPCPPGKGCQL